jgi:hypothetical protein
MTIPGHETHEKTKHTKTQLVCFVDFVISCLSWVDDAVAG